LIIEKKKLSLDRWRKIQQVGLAKEYKEKDSLTGKWIRHIFGLIFLKPEELGDTFVFDFICDQPDDPRVLEFIN
jgi:hypothetical protein